MAQHDYNLANQSGADFRADLNNALSAIATTNSGATSPSTTFAHQLWVDTANSVLKIRNSANDAWITTGVSITADNTFTGNITGNASTATALETARTINGTSFDGTANISFDTDSVSEGSSNLYFTNARVESYLDAGTSTPTFASAVINSSLTGSAVLDDDTFGTASATTVATSESIKAYVDSQVGSVDTLAEILLNGNSTGGTDIAVSTGDDITFADSSKAIFGTGSDLSIYHDGGNSRILDNGTGFLAIGTNGSDIRLTGNSFNEYMAKFVQDGAVELYYDNSKKLATTSTGIDVTGNITIPTGNKVAFDTDGLTYITEDQDERLRVWVHNTEFIRMTNTTTDELRLLPYGGNVFAGGNLDVTGTVTADGLTINNVESPMIELTDLSTGNELQIYADNSGGVIRTSTDDDLFLRTNSLNRIKLDNGGDISFYDDTGSTQGLFWDASTERLGIGTTSPQKALNVFADGTAPVRFERNTSDGQVIQIYKDGSAVSSIGTNSIGIGTSLPVSNLHIKTSVDNSFAQGLVVERSANSDRGYINYNGGGFQFRSTVGDPIVFGDTSNEYVRIANGSVGIGTSSPSEKLTIKKTVTTGDGATALLGVFAEGGAAGEDAEIYLGHSSSRAAKIVAHKKSSGNNHDLSFSTNADASAPTEKMRITSGGNVGIGTTSPSATLEVAKGSEGDYLIVGGDNASNGRALVFTSSTATSNGALHTIRAQSGNGEIAFSTGTSEALRIDSSQNVGIGTTSPARTLEIISGTSSESYLRISGQSGNVADTNFAGIEFYNTDSSGKGPNVAAFIEARAADSIGQAGELVFATAATGSTPEGERATERLRIDASGNVGIGTTSPRAILDLKNSGDGTLNTTASNYQILLEAPQGTGDYGRNIGWAVGSGTVNASINAVDAGASNATGLAFSTGAESGMAERMRIDSSGNVGIGTSSPDTMLHISDTLGNAVIRLERNDTGIVNGDQYGAIEFEGQDINTDASGVRASIRAKATASLGQTALTFSTASNTATESERMRIAPDGNVGIGTSSPNTILEIASGNSGGDAALDSPTFRINNTTESADWDVGDVVGTIEYYTSDVSGNAPYVASFIKSVNETGNGTLPSGALTFGTATYNASGGAVERLRIDSSGNVGIGTTSIGKTLTVGGSGLRVQSTASADFYSTGQDALIVNNGTANLKFWNNGSERMRIDSSGNVGIAGATTIDDGDLQIGDANSSFNIAIAGTRAKFGYASDNAIVQGGTSKGIAFCVNNNTLASGEAGRFDSSGNLLVGKTASGLSTDGAELAQGGTAGKVQITRTSNAALLLNRRSTDGTILDLRKDGTTVGSIGTTAGYAYYNGSQSGIDFYGVNALPTSGGTNVAADAVTSLGNSNFRFKDLYLSGTANVGLLEVYHATTDTVANFESGDNSVAVNFTAADNSMQIATSGTDGIIKNNGAGSFRLFNNGSERARIDAAGNLFVNQTATSDYTNTVGSSFRATGFSTHTRDAEAALLLNRLTDDGHILIFRKDNATVGSISVTSSATTYNTSSDARLKDVTGEARGLEVITKLNPVAYNWKADGKADEGLIAQEVKEIVPNAVSGSEDEHYQMDYSKLVTHLVAGMKEQQEQIESLKSEIAKLKGE